jgi:hypothetical protein
MNTYVRQALDLTYPMTSMFTGSAFNKSIEDVFGNTQIEDLWIPYFCISTDISVSKARVHTSGQLSKFNELNFYKKEKKGLETVEGPVFLFLDFICLYCKKKQQTIHTITFSTLGQKLNPKKKKTNAQDQFFTNRQKFMLFS